VGKKIFLIRHGQTDYNLNGIVQGSGVNAPLNENGKRQADQFYKAYQSAGIQKVYTSALIRTHQSVQGFIDSGIGWEILPELNEISWGKHEGKLITPEEDAYYRWLMIQWQQGRTDLKIEQGESPDEVSARLKVAIKTIMQDSADQILICMHGRAMRMMLCLLQNMPLQFMDQFEHSNLCLYQLEQQDSGFQVLTRNCTAHLKTTSKVNS
jgi:broad specificity phosphatase PhoE